MNATNIDLKKLFNDLYTAKTEDELENIIQRKYQAIFNSQANWKPYGDEPNNYSVIENQQASPIPSVVEKLTNAIDALLTKECHLQVGDPKSPNAPQSIQQAVDKFFPTSKNWDLGTERTKQSENIQIIADGVPPTKGTSLIIYDNGEGQHPKDFENTFLSLLRGNKNEIRFVHGQYNMGGAGAVVYCGKKRYQLIASRRFDKTGEFGFTLVRRHPLTEKEDKTVKNTWYEYLVLDGKIPSFPITTLDLGLHNRQFETGTVIKLYSYDLRGNYLITRDLSRSINEYLFQPALPIYTIEKEERYPRDRNLNRDLYGLKRRLERDDNKYIEKHFSIDASEDIGDFKITVYVFKAKIDGKTVKETKETIRDEFFKNNMSVLFSMHGQVHGNYTSEFISRSLKYNILTDFLLIHVDCTNLKREFRSQLFMASRDRLKEGEEAGILRKRVADSLKKSELDDIYKARKASITLDSADNDDLIRSFTKNLPIKSDLLNLFNQTFKLDREQPAKKESQSDKKTQNPKPEEAPPFNPKRYPTSFKIQAKNQDKDGISLIQIPIGGDRVVRFATDVEDEYFDRSRDPGTLKIAILDTGHNETGGGDQPGPPKNIQKVFDIVKSSPQKGTIKVRMSAHEQEIKVGEQVKIKAELSSVDGSFEEIFWVKITDPDTKPPQEKEQEDEEKMGLPELLLLYQESNEAEKRKGWDEFSQHGIEFDFPTVMYPICSGDTLETICVNMDSTVLRDYKSKHCKSVEDHALAEKRYISAIYFHTLFLYAITKNKKYGIQKLGLGDENNEVVNLENYLSDVFSSHYAQFLLNFGLDELLATIG